MAFLRTARPVGALLVLACAAYVLAPAGSELLALAGGELAFAIYVAMGIRRWPEVAGRGWHLIAAAIATFALGDLLRYLATHLSQAPIGFIADAVYLVAYVPLILGLLRILRDRAATPARSVNLLDASILTITAGAAAWTLVIQDRIDGLPPTQQVVYLAYPLADLLLAGLLVRWVFDPSPLGRAVALIWLAVVVLLMSDLGYLATQATSGLHAGLYDFGYLLSDALFALSALSASAPPRRPSATVERLTVRRFGFLLAASSAGPLLIATGGPLSDVDRWVIALASLTTVVLVLLRVSGLLRELDRVTTQRTMLLDGLVHASEQERTRMAADLHDTTIQGLTAVVYALEEARMELDDHHAAEPVGRAQAMVGGEIAALRGIMNALRPPVLEERGLDAALRDLARSFELATRVPCDASLELDERLDPSVEVVVFRVVQEALQNVSRHADASHVQLAVVADRAEVRVLVVDDGVGIDSSTLDAKLATGHFGITGMRERARMLGGSCSVERRLEGGTRVEASVPVTAPVGVGALA